MISRENKGSEHQETSGRVNTRMEMMVNKEFQQME